MPSSGKRIAQLVGIALAILLLSVVAQEDAPLTVEVNLGLGADEWSWESVMPILEQMNADLAKTIDEYENGDIDYEEVVRRISSPKYGDSDLIHLKRQLLASLPDIGGVPFIDVYDKLGSYDDYLVNVCSWEQHGKDTHLWLLRQAKEAKENLEQMIEEAATESAAPALP